jgi:hypothetical protein
MPARVEALCLPPAHRERRQRHGRSLQAAKLTSCAHAQAIVQSLRPVHLSGHHHMALAAEITRAFKPAHVHGCRHAQAPDAESEHDS